MKGLVMLHRWMLIVSLFAVTANAAPSRPAEDATATGLGLSLPLAARLAGAGNVLYTTSIDISNHTAADAQVDFYFDGVNVRTGDRFVITGTIANDGVHTVGEGVLRARSSVHLEDFVAVLANAGMLPSSSLSDGVLGSSLFVFNGMSRSGQASVVARFKNASGDGTVGVSLRAREVTGREPQHLVAAVRDSRGNDRGEAQLYPNLFINHMGLTPAGNPSTKPITVEVSAVDSAGQRAGSPLTLTIRSGETAAVNSVLQALQVPSSEENVLVYARVISGDAAIQGLVSQVDSATRDGSVFEMSRADF